MTEPRDAYEELGVSPSAEQDVIEAAYLALIKKYHPDHHEGPAAAAANERAQRVNAAWAEIATAEKRRNYDARRAAGCADQAPRASPAPPPRPGARVSVARYFRRLRGNGERQRIGPAGIALVVLTLLLLGLWMADVRRYWNDPVPAPEERR
jgi:curved DNA-binding protein CbpA